VFHISIWGIVDLFGGAKLKKTWRSDWILGPCDSVPPIIGGYGGRLIRLWV